MTLYDIMQKRHEFLQRHNLEPNAIILDFYGSTEWSAIVESAGPTVRCAGSKPNEILGMRVIPADITGFIIALV